MFAYRKNRAFWMALILVAHVGLSLGFNVFTPLYEATDEEGHVMYVHYLQLYKSLPVQGMDLNAPRAYHPPGYYLLGALLTSWMPEASSGEVAIQLKENPKHGYAYGTPGNDNKAYYLHDSPDELWPFHGFPRYVHVMRLLSLGFSLLAVWLTYQTACVLYPRKFAFPLLAASLIAFNPLVDSLSGIVRHDTAVLAAAAAIMYLLSRAIRLGFTPRRWWGLGLVLGLGVMIKFNVLTLAAPVGIALLWETSRTRRWQSFVYGGLGLGIPILLLDGWWFVRNQVLYGDWTTMKLLAIINYSGPLVIKWDWLPVAIPATLRSMLGSFGAGQGYVFLPGPIYEVAGVVALAALLGWCWSGSSWLKQRKSQAVEGTLVDSVLDYQKLGPEVSIWAVHGVTFVVVTATCLDYILTLSGAFNGIYMFAAYPALALFLTAGLLAWFKPRWHGWVAIVAIAANLGLALYALFGVVRLAYAPPHSPTADELSQMMPLDANVGNVARVLGYTLDTEAIKAGQALAVTVYWQPLIRTPIPYTVFIHLYEPSVGSITQRDTYPGLGNWATTLWTPNQTFVDTYRLVLPANASSVNGAEILLGLYDEKTTMRLPVTGKNAGPRQDAWVEFGSVRVEP